MKSKKNLTNFFLTFTVILVTLTLFEQIVRFENFGVNAFSYKRMDSITSWGESGASARYNNQFPLESVPNMSVMFKGTLFETNSIGMRDKGYTRNKPANIFRIVVLGDSMTRGAGVLGDETYHNVFETMLEKKHPGTFEVLSLGGTCERFLKNTTQVLYFEPDMLIFQCPVFNALCKNQKTLKKIRGFRQDTGVAILVLFLDNMTINKPGKGILTHSLNITYGKTHYIYPSDKHPDASIHRLYGEKLFEYTDGHLDKIMQLSTPSYKVPDIDLSYKKRKKLSGFWKCYLCERVYEKTREEKARVMSFYQEKKGS